MSRLKITRPGFETLTGILSGVQFTNGLSPIISLNKIDQIAANMAGNLMADDGTTVIGVAGALARDLLTGRNSVLRPVGVTTPIVPTYADAMTIKTISDLTYTLKPDDGDCLLDFTGACVITVPPTLVAGFSCGVRQGGASRIRVVPASGVTLEEIDNQFYSERRLAVLTIARFPDLKYQIVGRTSA